MLSTVAAFLSAVASGLVWLHHSNVIEVTRDVCSPEPITPCLRGSRVCRLHADVVLSPLRERAIVLILSPRSDLEILCGCLAVLALVGVLSILGALRRCCCRRRVRVQAVRRVLGDGAQGASRRIAGRVADGSAR